MTSSLVGGMTLVFLLGSVTACADADGPRSPQSTAATGSPSAYIGSPAIAEYGGGDSEALFEVVDGVLRRDVVIIAERSTGTLRFYSRRGELSRVVGGLGEGPGEFSRLSWLQVVGDRLFAYDASNRRLSEFDLKGSFINSVQFNPIEPYATASAIGVFQDSTILVAAREFPSNTAQEGVVRREATLFRYDMNGKVIERTGTYRGSETYVEPFGKAGQLSSRLVFGKRSSVAVLGNRILVVESDQPGVIVYDQSGTRLDTLQHSPTLYRRAVSAEDIRQARERFVADETPDFRLGEIFDRMPKPDSLPPYGWANSRHLRLLQTTSDDRIWTLFFGGLHSDTPLWSVFDADGSEELRIRAAREMNVLDALGDTALTLWWDDLGVEHVELHELVGAATSGTMAE